MAFEELKQRHATMWARRGDRTTLAEMHEAIVAAADAGEGTPGSTSSGTGELACDRVPR